MSKARSSTTAVKPVTEMTAAERVAHRERLLSEMQTIALVDQQEAEAINTKLGDFIKGIPAQIKAICGRELTGLSDLRNLIKQVESGTLGKLASTTTHHSPRIALASDKQAAMLARLQAREQAIKENKVPETLTAITEAFDIADATLARYKSKWLDAGNLVPAPKVGLVAPVALPVGPVAAAA